MGPHHGYPYARLKMPTQLKQPNMLLLQGLTKNPHSNGGYPEPSRSATQSLPRLRAAIGETPTNSVSSSHIALRKPTNWMKRIRMTSGVEP